MRHFDDIHSKFSCCGAKWGHYSVWGKKGRWKQRHLTHSLKTLNLFTMRLLYLFLRSELVEICWLTMWTLTRCSNYNQDFCPQYLLWRRCYYWWWKGCLIYTFLRTSDCLSNTLLPYLLKNVLRYSVYVNILFFFKRYSVFSINSIYWKNVGDVQYT